MTIKPDINTTQNAPKKGRAIITRGRNLMAFVIAHSLYKQGIECIGCDSVDFTVLQFSKTVQDYFVHPDPSKDEDIYLEQMLAHVKAHKPTNDVPYVLIPSFKDMTFFARHKEAFTPYIKITAPNIEAIEQITTKDKLSDTVKKYDVSAPACFTPKDEKELSEISSDIDFPVFIKPYDECSGRGVKKVNNVTELKQAWADNLAKYGQKSVIQALAKGDEYCYCAIYDQGTRKAGMAYKNLYNFPRDAGAGAMRETVEAGPYANEADKLMKALKWNGVAEFDFMWNEKANETPQLIEVNARFWSGLYQSVESGIDFPYLLYQLTADGCLPDTQHVAEIGTRTKLPYVWLLSVLEDIINHEDNNEAIEALGAKAIAQMNKGEIWEGLKEFTNYATAYTQSKLDFTPHKQKLDLALSLGKSARNEILDSDDPFAALGILFILSSLLRHGRLPREIKV